MCSMKKIRTGLITFALGALFLPAVAHAQQVRDIQSLIQYLLGIIDQLVVLVVGLGLLVFLWGLARFIMQAGDKDAVKEGKNLMFWGIIALFVMTSVWGIVNILENSFFGSNSSPTMPPSMEV